MSVGGERSVAVATVGPRQSGPRRRRNFWLPAIVVAIGVHAAAFFALEVSSGHGSVQRHSPRGLRWVGEQDNAAIEVLDPKPIFLPTRWNATARGASESDSRGPGDIFGLEEQAPLIDRSSSPAGLVVLPDGPRTAGVAIRRFSRPYFSAFGQEDRPVQRLPLRAASLEVRDAASGKVVFRSELDMDRVAAVGADVKRWSFWDPFEVLIAVEPTGMVGLPLIAAPGSRSDIVDDFFRTNLRTLLRPDLVLPAGYYRVVIGP